MNEACESKVANLVVEAKEMAHVHASLDELRIAVDLVCAAVMDQQKCMEALQKQVAEVPRITVEYGEDKHCPVCEFHMGFAGEGNYTWFEATLKDGRKIQSWPMKGEV